MVFALDNRWRRDYRWRGRSLLSISFSHNLYHTKISGMMHLYLGRWTLEWQMGERRASFEVHLDKKWKPIEQWTEDEKREVGLVSWEEVP